MNCDYLKQPLCSKDYNRDPDEPSKPEQNATRSHVPTCADGWTPHGERCYKFIDTRAPDMVSHRVCRSENAHELSLNTEREQNFIIKWLTGKSKLLTFDENTFCVKNRKMKRP